jgi:hypothetical protein
MNRRFRLLFVFVGVFALTLASFAAQRQCVIIDAFTQWNCPPCASWNPQERSVLNAFTRDTVIAIKTHVTWPAPDNDAFNHWNAAECLQRRTYYNVNSVPMGFADGVVNFGQSTTTLRNTIRNRFATPSPCTIDNLVALTASPTTVQVSGRITAEQAMSGDYLYAVLMRDLVTYASSPGSNGETSFPDIFCDASPNFSTGSLITASPGSPFDFNVTLNRDATWDVEGLSVVVFVQHNATKEILQGTWAHISQDYAFSSSNDDPAQLMSATNGGETAYLIQLSNDGLQNDTYTVTLDGIWPEGWAHSVEENGGASDPNEINVALNSGESTFLIVRANPSGHAGHARFGVHIESAGNNLIQADYNWRLMAGLDVLVIDADGGNTYETYYEQALDVAAENLDVVWGWWDSSLDDVDYPLFDGIDALVWFTGDLWQETLSPIDQLNIQDYLDNGGRLLLSGQGIGFDMRNDQLFTDYLHAQYIRNFPIGTSVSGIAGTWAAGSAFPIVSGEGASNQSRQSSIEVRSDEATMIVNYDQEYNGLTQGAGLSVDDGNYKAIYLAFGMEAIATTAARASFMENCLNWLYGNTATPGAPNEVVPTEFSLMQNYPNPFNPETNIPFALPVRSNVKLSVYDLLGREVATLAEGTFEAGAHTVNWNASELSSGVYFYRLDAQGAQQNFNSTRKVVLMK